MKCVPDKLGSMIMLSHSIHSINFTFDRNGIEQFIQLFRKLLAQERVEIEVPFLHKDGTELPLTLSFSIGPENTLKRSKTRVQIIIESEDAEDTLERFRQAKSNPESLYPEWIQVRKLSNHKRAYLYVFFRSDLTNNQVI